MALTYTQKSYNPMLIEEAAAIAPEIELQALLEGQAPPKSKVERVIVLTPEYLKKLSIILAATPRGVLQGYFIWKAVQSASAYVDADAVKPYRRFVNVLAGKVCTPHRMRLMAVSDIYRTPTPPPSDGAHASTTSTTA
jgi:predicted metalloendopeptidase